MLKYLNGMCFNIVFTNSNNYLPREILYLLITCIVNLFTQLSADPLQISVYKFKICVKLSIYYFLLKSQTFSITCASHWVAKIRLTIFIYSYNRPLHPCSLFVLNWKFVCFRKSFSHQYIRQQSSLFLRPEEPTGKRRSTYASLRPSEDFSQRLSMLSLYDSAEPRFIRLSYRDLEERFIRFGPQSKLHRGNY